MFCKTRILCKQGTYQCKINKVGFIESNYKYNIIATLLSFLRHVLDINLFLHLYRIESVIPKNEKI